MKCPIDNAELVIAERQGIEIDYCPQCRGVWLDRGELDKIIERSASRFEQPRESEQRGEPERYGERDERSHSQKPHKRRKSFLGEIFDF